MSGALGGAIYLIGTLKLNGAIFEANKAGEEGTAIASVSLSSVVEFDDVSFKRNTYNCPSGEYGDDIVGTVRSSSGAVAVGSAVIVGLSTREWPLSHETVWGSP